MSVSPSSRSPRTLALVAALALLPATAAAQSLRGSPASIKRMHDEAVEHDLHFYETTAGVRQAARKGSFERLTGNRDYALHRVSFPYVTEQTHLFVDRLASQYRAECGEQLVVTSAMRPESRQPSNSAELSVHPTGMAVDLRRPTRGSCLRWLRTTLLALEKAGVLEATEEHYPAHFHVAVYPRPYERYVTGVTRVASAERPARDAAEADAEASSDATATRATATKSAAQRVAQVQYKVQRGDTLWHLARRYGTSVRRIQTVNHLKSSALRPGQRIVIPTGS